MNLNIFFILTNKMGVSLALVMTAMILTACKQATPPASPTPSIDKRDQGATATGVKVGADQSRPDDGGIPPWYQEGLRFSDVILSNNGVQEAKVLDGLLHQSCVVTQEQGASTPYFYYAFTNANGTAETRRLSIHTPSNGKIPEKKVWTFGPTSPKEEYVIYRDDTKILVESAWSSALPSSQCQFEVLQTASRGPAKDSEGRTVERFYLSGTLDCRLSNVDGSKVLTFSANLGCDGVVFQN